MLIIGVNLEITRIVHNKCVSACVAEYHVIAHALLCTFFKISLIFRRSEKTWARERGCGHISVQVLKNEHLETRSHLTQFCHKKWLLIFAFVKLIHNGLSQYSN